MATITTQDPEAWARLGVKIREQREALGMSRRQLSEEAGVSEKSIQVAEEGRPPRARWPQSLRLIEPALRWAEGSMVSILEGGEPEKLLDLFSITEDEPSALPDQESIFPDAGVRRLYELAHERGEEGVTPHTRARAIAEFPASLRKATAEVIEFGRKAVSYGADSEVAERYERAVEELLMDMIGRRLEYAGISLASDPGHLWIWRSAMKMDPVLRKEKEELARKMDRERRRYMESHDRETLFPRLPRTSVVGESDSRAILDAVRVLTERVNELSEKVDRQDASRKELPFDAEGSAGGS